MSPGRFDPDSYVPVSERVEKFRADHPAFGLLSEVVVDDGTRVVVKATVTDETGRLLATGHAEEIRGDGPVNKTNAYENAETSAWGRALAAMGYEVSRGIASREEMTRAHQRQSEPEPASLPDGWTNGAQMAKSHKELGERIRRLGSPKVGEWKAEHPDAGWPMAQNFFDDLCDLVTELEKGPVE